MSFVLTDKAACAVTGPDGSVFHEPSCIFPFFEWFYFNFEKYHKCDQYSCYNYIPMKNFLEKNAVIPYIAVTLYALFCYFGKKYFEKRDPWNFRTAMAAWNLFLTLYSMLTVLHGFPAFHRVFTTPFRDTLCIDPTTVFGGSAFVWTQLFVLSKFAELFDTFFIVVHKKPLIFLHWYHHITVLVYTWVAFTEKTPSALFFGPINAMVHSVMYGYYFLMAIKMKPKWMNAIWITVAQILQMVIGVTVSLFSFYYYIYDDQCQLHSGTLIASFFMYGSYLYLFASFFYNRYVRGNKNAKFAGETVNKKYV